ncbi:uncharacterized protein LOC129737994 [Uranotaenia lowii]|uniref:uncharacterized protein LOC129737994 n=1 Tax=Uranotaenia lowii TaxID=190385 RepID=UPI00247A2BBB|nr:uncharacterized protein LOC129737994 [Uranotaenia lowii]
MTFVGYSTQQKAYRFLDRSSGHVINSRDARFMLTSSFQEEEEGNGSIVEYRFSSANNFQPNPFPIVARDVCGEPADDESDDDTTLTEDHDADERPLKAQSERPSTSTPIEQRPLEQRDNATSISRSQQPGKPANVQTEDSSRSASESSTGSLEKCYG